MPYESFKPDRVKPLDLLKNLKRDYVESSLWVPVEDVKEGSDRADDRSGKSACVEGGQQYISRNTRSSSRSARIANSPSTLDQFFGAGVGCTASIGELLSTMDDDGDEDGGGQLRTTTRWPQDNELVKLVNKIIVDAYHQGASDIHIEPYPGKGKTEVRFRKDGTLHNYISVPASYRNAIVARLKVMCDLDISEKRKPQDGKIKFKKFGPLDIELRVATIPSAGSVEDIVMRILAAGEPIPLDKLGLSKSNLGILKEPRIEVSFEADGADGQKLVHAQAVFPTSQSTVYNIFNGITDYPKLHDWIRETTLVRRERTARSSW